MKLVAGALEYEQPMTELLKLGHKFFLDRKCVRRKEPIFFGKEAFFWESSTDRGEPVVLSLHLRHEVNVQRPTRLRKFYGVAGAERPTLNYCRASLRDAILERRLTQTLYNYRPAAILFSTSFTSSSADSASPLSCRSRTALWASTCL